jgi:hypothetical protein
MKWTYEGLYKYLNDNGQKEFVYEYDLSWTSELISSINGLVLDKRKKYRFIKEEMYFVDFESFEDLWTDNRKLLYNEGLTRDYYWYSRLPQWYDSDYMRGVYDFFNIFKYSTERYKILIVYMFKSLWLKNSDYTYLDNIFIHLDNMINTFKNDYLIHEEWFNSRYLLKDFLINNVDLTYNIIEKWDDSFIWKLYYKDWKKQGFFYLLTKEKLIYFCY